MPGSKNLPQLLRHHQAEYAQVVPFNLNNPDLLIFDLTDKNKKLQEINLNDTAAFAAYMFEEMKRVNTPVAIGRYNENRIIYKRSEHFQQKESRNIHLGIDIWAEAGTKVYSPMPAKVYSLQDNAGFGDYGPTVILQHFLENIIFYTLYGHLSRKSLKGLSPGETLTKGEVIGEIGNFPENGDWPPHLHFQVIKDMKGYVGDFPGVASFSTITYYLELCPDPNLILGINKLLD